MRRLLRPLLPALSAVFGLRPVDLEGMPPAEIDEYLAAMGTRR